jgi:response regulator RpfG family c-di-GMP phosphodiesterase
MSWSERKGYREPIIGMAADRLDFFPLRIFVVEDDNDTLAAIQIYLEQLGHSVFSARSKAEALKKIPRANCHVLISDINLPDGNGWEIFGRNSEFAPELCHTHKRLWNEG